MATADRPQYRASAWWPPLNEPAISVATRDVDVALDVHPFGPIAIRYGQQGDPRILPDEVVLRELQDLDLLSRRSFQTGLTLRSVVAFVQHFGMLDVERRKAESQWWVLVDEPDSQGTGPVDHPLMRVGREHFDAAVRAGLPTDDCTALLLVAQRIARHWIYYKDNLPSLAAWEGWPFDPPIEDEGAAWSAFEWYLNLGLHAFAPRVDYTRIAGDVTESSSEGITPHEPDLFDALCLQLYHLVLQDLPLRTCANESCQRRFTKQRGTAKAQQYRTRGVIYCSRSCASTQLSRERRRKQANKGRAS
jgi:hypothetical protein